jgi:hypothetical protein
LKYVPSKLETTLHLCKFDDMPVPEALTRLFQTPEPPELGPGPRPNVEPEAKLNQAIDKALSGSTLSANDQELIRALALLWHDHLEAAHVIAQSIENADGAYVHAIMHRREPDLSNAAYWFRRVGAHPAFEPLREKVAAHVEGQKESPLQNLVSGRIWDPFAFIKECERVTRYNLPDTHLREAQRMEFEQLLKWLCRVG